ncbi:MAG: hypothetical protein FVQ80_14500 [Planctomycetes bacterium]|nr:hypothetical protein [Planctomycetota bacterium]
MTDLLINGPDKKEIWIWDNMSDYEKYDERAEQTAYMKTEIQEWIRNEKYIIHGNWRYTYEDICLN